MSNLGSYQSITKLAKTVGGPKVLGLLTAFAGYLIIRVTEAGSKKVYRLAKSAHKSESPGEYPLFTVTADSNCGGGLSLTVGDQFIELGRDNDSVQIEVLGNDNNPYYVSAMLLEGISDYLSFPEREA